MRVCVGTPARSTTATTQAKARRPQPSSTKPCVTQPGSRSRVNSVAAPKEYLPWFAPSGRAHGCQRAERRPGRPRLANKILFASAHSIVDFSNGASVATLDVLQGLTTAGFECQAFCTAKLDFQTEVCLEEIVDSMREPIQVQPSVCGRERRGFSTRVGQHVPITIIRLDSTRHGTQRPEEVQTVLEFFEKFLDVNRPDVMLTYGGDPITLGMIAEARRRGVPGRLRPAQLRVYESAILRQRRLLPRRFRVRPTALPRQGRPGLPGLAYPIDWDRVRVESREPRFVTFVNPCSEKGVYAFARIAHELGRRRPDIPLLVVESRGNRQDLGACGLDLAAAGNIQIMPHTTDPRRFWGLTKIALLPSLWWENQPLVAIEAMINGIPVIGSDRGGIPEALGECGIYPAAARAAYARVQDRARGRGGRALGRDDHPALG